MEWEFVTIFDRKQYLNFDGLILNGLLFVTKLPSTVQKTTLKIPNIDCPMNIPSTGPLQIGTKVEMATLRLLSNSSSSLWSMSSVALFIIFIFC